MKLVIWIVVALAVVFGGWRFMQARELASYGIDEAHPFGSFGKLDAMLTGDMHFEKDEAGSDAIPYEDLPEPAHTFRYRDTASGSTVLDKVWLQVAADGRLLSISAWSRPTYTAVATLMYNHWGRITGELPDYSKGQGDFTGQGFRGHWTWAKPGGLLICLAVR
ncbi:MAG: hypothetical protein AAB152_11930 [Candidatus Coatesbacteria bacterium]